MRLESLMPMTLEKPTPIHAMDIFNFYLGIIFIYFFMYREKVGREKMFLMILFTLPALHFIGRFFSKPRLYNVYHILLAVYFCNDKFPSYWKKIK